MKITMIQTVREGRDLYRSGEVRILEDDQAETFIERGWAVLHESVTLDIHDGRIGHVAKEI